MTYKDAQTREINCSLEKSTWRLCIYDSAEREEGEGSGDLRAGDMIYFHDPDSKMTLMLHDPHTVSVVLVLYILFFFGMKFFSNCL